MNRIATLLLLIASMGAYTAQGQSALSLADKEYKSMSYLKASSLYEEAVKDIELSKEEMLVIKAKLANSYRQLKDFENTERVLREIISDYGEDLPDAYVDNYLYYAQALASNGKYNEAQEAYQKYTALSAEDQRGSSFSKLYNNVTLLTKNAGSYKVERLDINTSDADFSPMYYKEGIVFVSGRSEVRGIKRLFNWNRTPFLNLYYLNNLKNIKGKTVTAPLGGSTGVTDRSTSIRKRRSLLGRHGYTALTANDSRTVGIFTGSAYNLNLGYEETPQTELTRFNKSTNSKYHEGPVSFSGDGNRAIFTRNNYKDGKRKVSEEGVKRLKLYSSELVNGTWSNIKELPFNSDEYSTGHPALNPDNTLLYFASDRPGGEGGTDIYVSRLEDGKWSEPTNMGPEVNTEGKEMFPYIDPNGQLYFSSDGHPGLGGLDVFFAPLETYAKAKKSINLGAPINSDKDDFGLITDGERMEGYFSSNRKESRTDDDIYRFRREGPTYACRDLTITVYDESTKEPLKNASVQIEDKNSPEEMLQLQTDSLGNLFLCLAAENEFVFVASEEGYQNSTLGFMTSAFDDERPSMLEIPLKRVVEKKPAEVVAMADNAKGYVLDMNGAKPLSGAKIKDDTDGTTQEIATDENRQYDFIASPDLNVHMFEKGESTKTENIYHDLDKANICPFTAQELDKVVEILEKYPDMKIEVCAHTDSRATSLYYRILSNNRAKEARSYLISKGIDGERIDAKGCGESKLVNDRGNGCNCSEEEHQKKSRTEIRIKNLQ
ncbi:OmpA family protein [Persicitalea sp.]|uniref:OmpA family protein n=1 Tax=Persicitalea sp. TaxID=3100273 RepID=UPI0035942CA4